MEARFLVRQIKQVYAAIASKIEELILLLNEAEGSKDQNTKELAARITVFLGRLEQSIGIEQRVVRISQSKKKGELLPSLERELKEIKALEVYITLAAKKPTPILIKKIHELYREVQKEIETQEKVLNEAA